MTEVVVQCERKMKATRARANTKFAKLKAEQRSYEEQAQEKLRDLQGRIQNNNDRYAEMNDFLHEISANVKLINERIRSLPPAKPAELQEEDALAKDSRARRIIKPNKRFYSNE